MAEVKWRALSDCRDGVVMVLGTGIGITRSFCRVAERGGGVVYCL